MRSRLVRVIALVGVVPVLGGCGEQPPPDGPAVVTPAQPPVGLVSPVYDGRFRAVGTVLENRDHGPQLCVGVIGTSDPPTCSGPDIMSWDWDAVPHTVASGTTYGSYVLVGSFEDETFVLTEPPVVDDGTLKGPMLFAGTDLSTPCPPPPGGWTPVEPARTTYSAYQAAAERAESLTGFGGVWIAPIDPGAGWTTDDPERFVLNVSTTGDLPAMERELRALWGGSLCVSKAVRSEAELSAVQAALTDLPGMVAICTDVREGHVVVEVHVATVETQRELDERFGAGVVRQHGLLVPID